MHNQLVTVFLLPIVCIWLQTATVSSAHHVSHQHEHIPNWSHLWPHLSSHHHHHQCALMLEQCTNTLPFLFLKCHWMNDTQWMSFPSKEISFLDVDRKLHNANIHLFIGHFYRLRWVILHQRQFPLERCSLVVNEHRKEDGPAPLGRSSGQWSCPAISAVAAANKSWAYTRAFFLYCYL